MGLLKKIAGSFKKHDELDLAKGFKAEYEVNNLENMKSFADKFVDHYPDSYFASRGYKSECYKNVKFMESEGLRFSSEDK